MKKFALLGAVAALATAGGVFAAWHFSNGETVTKTGQLGITVDTQVVNNLYGSITVSGSLSLSLAGDGTVDENNIEPTWNGAITFHYEEAEASGSDVAKGYTYALSATTIESTFVTIAFSSTGAVTLDGDGNIVIDENDFTFTQNNTVDTSDDLDTLKTELNGKSITVTLTATPVPAE